MKISYNWLSSYIKDIPESDKLADLFTYHVCEVESVQKLPTGDVVCDLGVLPNRAHDLLSHRGVAKELASLLGLSFSDPESFYKIPEVYSLDSTGEITRTDLEGLSLLQVEINSPSCRRYMSRIVRSVKVGPSPKWIVDHLEAIGQRSINNIVDATNIVMYDCGNPTHAFDLQKIGSEVLLESKKIVVRNALEDEELKLVGREGIVAKLKNTDLVITDGNKTLAIAGIKGGFDSGVSSETCDILLEVGNFDPVSCRKTARRLNIVTDSAKRFENNLSPELCDLAMKELSALIFEMCPDAKFEEIVDIYPTKEVYKNKKTISFSTDFINKKLGSKITTDEVEKILKNYGYEYTKSSDALFEVVVPHLRFDLENPIDMVEEIGRVYGYSNIEAVLPSNNFSPKENDVFSQMSKARYVLAMEGYKEVATYGFRNDGDIQVLASASDKSFLRSNLLDGLKKSYELNKTNASLLGMNEIKIFEIGSVFNGDTETINIAYVNKKESNEMPLSLFLTKTNDPMKNVFEILEEFFKGSVALTDEKNIVDSSKLVSSGKGRFSMWSLYPYIVRDIATWVPVETDKSVLVDIYKENGGEFLLGEPMLFDTFTKNERTSYAYRLIFQSYDKTLTDEEINPIIENIQSKIKELGFEIR